MACLVWTGEAKSVQAWQQVLCGMFEICVYEIAQVDEIYVVIHPTVHCVGWLFQGSIE